MSILNSNTKIAIDAYNLLRINGVMTNSDIATRIGKGVSFVEQTMRKLRLKGIVTSLRGPGGGYMLRSGSVSLYEVMEACGQSKPEALIESHADKVEEDVLDIIARYTL